MDLGTTAAALTALTLAGSATASFIAKTVASWGSRSRAAEGTIPPSADASIDPIVFKSSKSAHAQYSQSDVDALIEAVQRGEDWARVEGLEIVDAASQVARTRVVARLKETALARTEQLRTEKWSRISANLLTIAQYIIGGVLASSFVQESLTSKWVGGLGVLVLIASLFKQQFRPELNAEDARIKASKLRALIRMSEDRLAIIDAKTATGQDHSDAMILLLTEITKALTDIEDLDGGDSRPQLSTK